MVLQGYGDGDRSGHNVEDDRQFCISILPQVSRTFALSIAALPPELQEPVRSAYLICRILDTIEDDTSLPPTDREALFDSVDATLRAHCKEASDFENLVETRWAALRDGSGAVATADAELCRNSRAVFRCFAALPVEQREAIEQPCLTMSRGMRAYARKRDRLGWAFIKNVEELEDYCYYVAGTVGEMLTALFLLRHPQPVATREVLVASAVPFGLALQLVNIVKDVADDTAKGRFFLPLDAVTEMGLEPAHFLHDDARPRALLAVRTVCSRARRHLEAARRYVHCWSPRASSDVRLFTAVPLALAIRTLDLVALGGPDVLRAGRNPKVQRTVVADILAQAQVAASDEQAMRALLLDDTMQSPAAL